MFDCDDLACEVAKFLCTHLQLHVFAIVSSSWARVMIHNLQHVSNLRDPVSHETCADAAEHGHLTCLRYLQEQKKLLITESTFHAAVQGGSLECFKYLATRVPIKFEWVCTQAAKHGHLNILIYAHENDFPWNANTCAMAAKHGHLACLMYAYEHDCSWNEYTCQNAIKFQHLDCLEYALDNFCDSYNACDFACTVGSLECVKFIRQKTGRWGNVCAIAAGHGFLDILKYAHENKCPWDQFTTQAAVENNQRECFLYAYTNNCPCRSYILSQAKEKGYV